MRIIETEFDGLFVLEPKVNFDQRGYFIETFRESFFKNNINNKVNFVQDNLVYSKKMVLRGLHFQKKPFSQSKLVTVIKGSILDVVVDIRKFSNTYGKYFTINLSAENKKMLFIPKGFAHGYLTLENDTIIKYKVDNEYNESSEDGIPYDDSYLNIDWVYDKKDFIISKKDKAYKDYLW